MQTGDILDERQLLAVGILGEGKGVSAAAKACGVSRTAIYQWLAKPHFAEAVRRIQYGVLRNTYNRLIFANENAVNTLRGGLRAKQEIIGYGQSGQPIMGDPKHWHVRHKSAVAILDLTLRYGEKVAMQDELALIREEIAELKGERDGDL